VAAEAGLAGLEFYRGVPGSVGGALRMNAGAYQRETKDVLVEARAVDRKGNVHVLKNADFKFSYRHSELPADFIATQAIFRGEAGDKAAIKAEMDKITEAREATQAVMHDDGKHVEGLEHADFVLVGLSRTGKTPLSVYLSLEGWRVGNVPLVQGLPVPPEVLALPREKVIGLLVNPRRLAEIRRARMAYMAPGHRMSYEEEESVREEIVWCRRLFGELGIRSVDVTQKAIEESAHQVLAHVNRNSTDTREPPDDEERVQKRA
jgi:hypothetical protein